jgi:hypothetical protein
VEGGKQLRGSDELTPAAQINRVHLRSVKLKSQARARKDLKTGKSAPPQEYADAVFRPQFFMHSLESPDALTLPQLRALVTDEFIGRNDARIAELNAERRAGRPKGKELLELEELRRVESAEWETGFGECEARRGEQRESGEQRRAEQRRGEDLPLTRRGAQPHGRARDTAHVWVGGEWDHHQVRAHRPAAVDPDCAGLARGRRREPEGQA